MGQAFVRSDVLIKRGSAKVFGQGLRAAGDAEALSGCKVDWR